MEKTFNAVDTTEVRVVAGGGGVLANRRLRERLAEEAEQRGVELYLPTPEFCTDNGAMIAAAGGVPPRKGGVNSLDGRGRARVASR